MGTEKTGRRAAPAKRGGSGHKPPALPERRVESDRDLAAILNLVRSGEADTRHTIEAKSGLGRAVVAARLATLIERGLLEEGELGRAVGGRAPRLIRFRADAGLILVALLGPSSIGVGVADLSGRLVVEHHEAADLGLGPARILKRLHTLFDWALEQHQDNRKVWGIGLALPGPVEAEEARPFASPVLHVGPAWDDFPIVENLVVRYGAPVWIRSHVEMMALGEWRAGSGGGAKNLVFADLGREIGAGLILNGRPYRGAQGGAGMIGHSATGDDTAICRCGNTGCLDLVASSDAIAREGESLARDGRSRYLAEALAKREAVTAADVQTGAQLGDPHCAELLSRCGRLIGTALAAVTNALNPSAIVLGGPLAQTGDILLAAIREAVYRRAHPLVTRDLRITRSQMGNSAGLVGLALLVADDLFAGGMLDAWINLGTPLLHPEMDALLVRARQITSRADERPKPPAETALQAG
jgi:predicted NBD/HSP70 family sugar kinase